ncbi:MAG: OmpH family outer membrane protein [bacterium]
MKSQVERKSRSGKKLSRASVTCLIIAGAVFAAVALCGKPAYALEIGLVDYIAVVSSHPMTREFEVDLEKTKRAREDAIHAEIKKKYSLKDINEARGLSEDKQRQIQEMLMIESEKLGSEMKKKETETLKIVEGDILKAVHKIAKAKKLDYVINKPMVLFGGLDITDDVIEEIVKAM